MTEAKTALQMAERHVAEQEIRVHEQERLIVRLRSEGRPSEQAEGMLVEMSNLLDDMRGHLERLQQRGEGYRCAAQRLVEGQAGRKPKTGATRHSLSAGNSSLQVPDRRDEGK
jgi:hypothetical protein